MTVLPYKNKQTKTEIRKEKKKKMKKRGYTILLVEVSSWSITFFPERLLLSTNVVFDYMNKFKNMRENDNK